MVNFAYFFKLPESKEPIPGSDVALYWYLGKLISEKGVLSKEIESYFFSPVYALLYSLFTILGNSVRYASIFSGFSFLVSAIFMFMLAENIFNKNIATISVLIFVLYKPLLFYSLLPIKTVFFVLLLLIFLNLAQKTLYATGSSLPFIIGVISGIAMNTEGLFLPIFLTFVLYIALTQKMDVKSFFFLISGVIISLAPFSARNYIVSNNLYPLPSVSGIHFYIGNNLKAQGIYTLIPGVRPNAFGHYFDAKRIAEMELRQKHLSDSEVNGFWKKKAFKFILNNPTKFLKLYFKKILLSVNNFEVPNNFNINVIEKKIPILKYDPLTFSFLLPLSTVGILLCLTMGNQRANFLILLSILYPFILSLFFITSRYRIIWTVLLIPFASYSISFAMRLLNRGKDLGVLIKTFSLLLFSFLIYSITKFQLISFPTIKFMEKRYFRGEHLTEKLLKIDERLKVSRDPIERKILLKEKAGVMRRAGMIEVADFIEHL